MMIGVSDEVREILLSDSISVPRWFVRDSSPTFSYFWNKCFHLLGDIWGCVQTCGRHVHRCMCYICVYVYVTVKTQHCRCGTGSSRGHAGGTERFHTLLCSAARMWMLNICCYCICMWETDKQNRTDEMLKSCFTMDCIHRFRKILSWVLKAKPKERVHCNLLRQLESLCQMLGVLLPFLSEVCYISKNHHTWNSFWTTQWLDCDCISASLYMTVVLYDCQLGTKVFQEWLILPFNYTSICSASCSAEVPHNFKLNWSVF